MIKKKLTVLILFFYCFNAIQAYALDRTTNQKTNAVTYSLHGSNTFGKQLYAYLHAKWISHVYHIPLIYHPFIYSDQLALHNIELEAQNTGAPFSSTILFQANSKIYRYQAKRVLYIVPFFNECLQEGSEQSNTSSPLFSVNWKTSSFRKELHQLIAPGIYQEPFSLPTDRINVAVHVRRGIDFNTQTASQYPLKFLPDSFYISQIQALDDSLNHQPLYVYIFTDYHDPQFLLETYRNAIGRQHIVFNCRSATELTFITPVNDLFAMTQFHCLIRPSSHFSSLASLLADYRMEIFPKGYHIEAGRAVIEALSVSKF
jgi:hypothetical protein